MRLEGKVALITYAAAGVEGELMGFGGAAARLFVQEGAKVVITDIKEELGERTAVQIRENGGEALFIRHDVTSEQNWIDVIRTAVSTYGKLDILVNNAETSRRGKNVEGTTVEAWDGQMNVHAKGAFLGTKHAIPEMRRAGGGSIINISSISGLIGTTSTAYDAAKAAIRLFTKSAAIQYAKENIRVNSVHPGYAWNLMTSNAYGSEDEWKDLRLPRIPLARPGNAYDIAYGILYLASDESSFVTGSELVIDGGTTAQ